MRQELIPKSERIIGTAEQVANVLRARHAEGRLQTDPRTIVPQYIGIRRDVRGAASTEDLYVVDVVLLADKPKRRSVLSGGGSDIAKALAFVGGLFALGLVLLVSAFLVLRETVTPQQIGTFAGVAVLVLIVVLIIANRANHSGACPGVAVHCKGCRH